MKNGLPELWLFPHDRKKAYDMLVMEGLIYRKQGQGSFVLSSKINRPEVETVRENSLDLLRQPMEKEPPKSFVSS